MTDHTPRPNGRRTSHSPLRRVLEIHRGTPLRDHALTGGHGATPPYERTCQQVHLLRDTALEMAAAIADDRSMPSGAIDHGLGDGWCLFDADVMLSSHVKHDDAWFTVPPEFGCHAEHGAMDEPDAEDERRDTVALAIAEALNVAALVRAIGPEHLIGGPSADWDLPIELHDAHEALWVLADGGDPTAALVAEHLNPLVDELCALAIASATMPDEATTNWGAGS